MNTIPAVEKKDGDSNISNKRDTGSAMANEDLKKAKRQSQEGKTVKKQFPVTGLSCASCASNVELKLNNQPGVVSAAVNLASQIATIEYQPSLVKPLNLKESVISIGYDLIIDESAKAKEELENLQQKRLKSL